MIPIHLEQVSKTYGSLPPTITMDLAIEQGEFFTLLGPSGCGKSTMLRMIAGFISPTSGRIRFGDRDVTHVSPNRRDTGMVFQNYALFPHMSVGENVAYGLATRKVPRRERGPRVQRALDQVGLAGFGDRRIHELSGGQQQRVALARAIVISPSLLLLDEPLSNLDAKLREETRLEIRRIQQEARITTVYVTHDQAEAMAMSDRVAVLEGGRVHQVAAPRDIYRRPATTFVARFIGNSNVLTSTVEAVLPDRAEVTLPNGRAAAVMRDPERPVSKGDEAAVSMRPEDLRLCAPEDGLLSGTVTSMEFTGPVVTYEIRVGDHLLTASSAEHDDAPRIGDRVGVDCDVERRWLVVGQ